MARQYSDREELDLLRKILPEEKELREVLIEAILIPGGDVLLSEFIELYLFITEKREG